MRVRSRQLPETLVVRDIVLFTDIANSFLETHGYCKCLWDCHK
jgi:hypothetical protein